jgi:NADH-quinone oxidoreductase subunit L
MRAAMSVLAVLALFGGLVQIPGVVHVISDFLEPVFEESHLAHIHPTAGAEWLGLAIGGAISLLGIAIAYLVYVKQPARPRQLETRLRPLHTLFANKWYFDELIDFLVVRPALAIGRFSNRVFERFVVDGLVSGTAETVRGAGGVVRAVQSGFVRSYALLLIAGFAGLALYFLLNSSGS